MKKKPAKLDVVVALLTWINLNAVLTSATETECQTLLKAEQRGKGRPTFLRRIHSRLNKVRAGRERQELV
jgi:hypothetical protein